MFVNKPKLRQCKGNFPNSAGGAATKHFIEETHLLPASMTGGAVSNSVACYEGIRLSARDKGVRGVIDASLDIAPPTLSPSDSSSTTTTSGPHALKSDEVFWRPLFLCPTSRRLEGAPSLDSPRHRLSTRCSTPPEWEDSDDEVPYSHPLVWAAATKRRML